MRLPTHTAIVVLLLSQISNANTITTTRYTDLPNSELVTYDIGQVPPGNVTDFGAVQVTNSPANSVFAGATVDLGPDDPIGCCGWGASTGVAPIKFEFSQPVAAFGVTFFHPFNGPGTLRVFDGPAATGELLGEIRSSSTMRHDFVAAWSDVRNIRSASIVGSGLSGGVHIGAMAVSLTPMPEPSSACLLLGGGLILTRRQNRLRE